MQFKSFIALSALLALTIAGPVPEAHVVTEAEFTHWLKTTDAKLTFIGKPIPGINAPEDLVSRAALDTMVSYCDTRTGSVCGGSCTVYNGGPTCLATPGTECMYASNNVGFCDREGCGNSCNEFNSCGTRLDAGYCYTPGTASINVGDF
ncbi:hypothetical protein BD626DRAFT_498244 [Schizophyllum amplum]|uniref:Uncharacterized protein n=1 Tax=Schizophyllum amplum TaxID=97359 RepID=A0A550CD69_9AGAR|nr:hypothetical protein BD626DRAFT_498244 [Auriculariopsis ampla]